MHDTTTLCLRYSGHMTETRNIDARIADTALSLVRSQTGPCDITAHPDESVSIAVHLRRTRNCSVPKDARGQVLTAQTPHPCHLARPLLRSVPHRANGLTSSSFASEHGVVYAPPHLHQPPLPPPPTPPRRQDPHPYARTPHESVRLREPTCHR